ncbi:putative ABC transporter, permease protein [Leucobacter sp. Psy1]|uniref:ABC transporter permease n=1 Tax=Leucobacter sp. Psy1 TaxID=2875729 RepID=UPI001CD2CC88|nr:ABC transporter permease [Leucobacter sp. Psy1]UBH04913.1 putative ABC transporter, permease protein [Leucobacter sp. Psy1]
MWEYIAGRWGAILFAAWQHFSLVAQCVILGTIIAVFLAVLCYRVPALVGLANGVTAIGLTIPSFALIGLLIAPVGYGVPLAVTVLTFFAVLPILRNAVVGLSGVESSLIESARGIGVSRLGTLARVELPLAWPVILTGIRISAQMVMGVAAVAAYALGPGLGSFIFTGLSQLGSANAVYSVLVGVIGVVIIALILDLILVVIGRLTTPKGIRV